MIIKLKDERQLTIRKTDPGISHQALDFLQSLYEEKAYVSVALGSQRMTLEEEDKTLKSIDWRTKLMLIAVYNDKIASIIDAHRRAKSTEEHAADVNVSVAKDFRNSGLAQFMIYNMAEKLFKQGVTLMYADVIADNLSGLKFIKSVGFNEIGTVKGGAVSASGKVYDKILFYTATQNVITNSEKLWKSKEVFVLDNSD